MLLYAVAPHDGSTGGAFRMALGYRLILRRARLSYGNACPKPKHLVLTPTRLEKSPSPM
jgi:hypothetical protein